MTDNSGFYSDYKRIIAISGLAAASGAFLTFVSVFLFPLPDEAKKNILYVALGVFVFIFAWHLNPKICLNKKIAFIPDLVYIVAISLIMKNTGDYSYIFFGFYMILAAVDAFMFPLLQYSVVVFGILAGIAVATPTGSGIFYSRNIFQYYGILAIATVLHLIARDALALKKKKESLEEDVAKIEKSKAEIMNLLESLNEGVFVVNTKNKITFFNQSALKILKITEDPETVYDKEISSLLPTLDSKNKSVDITAESYKTKRQVIKNDLRIINRKRTTRLHTNVTPVVTEIDELGGAIIFFRDITKEKLLEEQQAEFNAITSHELRTPLTIIEGYLCFLLDPSSKLKYDVETKGYIEKAYAASLSLVRLVSDILTLVKAENGDLAVSVKKIDVINFLENEVKKLKGQLESDEVSLSFRAIRAKDIPEIVTDPVKLKEIVDNLITNAFKFTKTGSVIVAVESIEEGVAISVTDTGIGIDEAEHDKIFDKYYRSESWKTRETSGTGIGLYIVKTLVKILGGEVGVSSELEKGSRFYFTLPIEYKKNLREDTKKLPELQSAGK